ncbi:unnamed protein product [Symbiodinium microadriaticum]|nr:unnamed protein product [Symbiodinium microadriaticum]
MVKPGRLGKAAREKAGLERKGGVRAGDTDEAVAGVVAGGIWGHEGKGKSLAFALSGHWVESWVAPPDALEEVVLLVENESVMDCEEIFTELAEAITPVGDRTWRSPEEAARNAKLALEVCSSNLLYRHAYLGKQALEQSQRAQRSENRAVSARLVAEEKVSELQRELDLQAISASNSSRGLLVALVMRFKKAKNTPEELKRRTLAAEAETAEAERIKAESEVAKMITTTTPPNIVLVKLVAKHKAKAEEEMAEKTKLVLKLKELEVLTFVLLWEAIEAMIGKKNAKLRRQKRHGGFARPYLHMCISRLMMPDGFTTAAKRIISGFNIVAFWALPALPWPYHATRVTTIVLQVFDARDEIVYDYTCYTGCILIRMDCVCIYLWVPIGADLIFWRSKRKDNDEGAGELPNVVRGLHTLCNDNACSFSRIHVRDILQVSIVPRWHAHANVHARVSAPAKV